MKFYKVVARPTLLYGSETWVTMTRDMTGLEAAEMSFLRSVKGNARLDKIRSEVIPYPTAFPYGNGMVLHFYQQQESSTTKTVHKVINKGLKTYV